MTILVKNNDKNAVDYVRSSKNNAKNHIIIKMIITRLLRITMIMKNNGENNYNNAKNDVRQGQ